MRSTRLFLVLLFAAGMLHAGETPVWQTDWNMAFKIAKEEHRLVFVDYFAVACSRTVEDTVLSNSEAQKRLNEFVLLREDFSRYNAPHGVPSFPTYAVYDYDERERFRLGDPNALSHEHDKARRGSIFPLCSYWGVMFADGSWLDAIRGAAPSFVRAAEMLDSGNELEADFLLGNTYAHLRMPGSARVMYEKARKLAEKRGDKATAQIAEAESAFTFAYENTICKKDKCTGDFPHAIKLLQNLAANPVNRDTEAFIWLALGRVYGIAKDPNAARAAYRRTQLLTAPDSAAYKEANAAIEKLH